MSRPISLFTGQWADLPLEQVARMAADWGFDGLELACWGDHFDVQRAVNEPGYCEGRWEILKRHGLNCWTISNHLVGQAVCDSPLDERHRRILPDHVWGDGEPEGVRERAAAEIMDTARAAARFGVRTVVGFTGSPIWIFLAGFPPVPQEMIDEGYKDFARRWNPIIDVFDEVGVRFALEVHPSEIAYDYWTTLATLDAMDHRPGFGLNFDPSHLMWQDIDPVSFLADFRDRIYHVHLKESVRQLNGRNGRLASHLPFGDPRRGWDFVSAGHGDVPWGKLFRMLNSIEFDGAVSVEWEDSGMEREVGAPESLKHVQRYNVRPPTTSFDAAFAGEAG
jgi:sugar phosphate isomerase/epimerase